MSWTLPFLPRFCLNDSLTGNQVNSSYLSKIIVSNGLICCTLKKCNLSSISVCRSLQTDCSHLCSSSSADYLFFNRDYLIIKKLFVPIYDFYDNWWHFYDNWIMTMIFLCYNKPYMPCPSDLQLLNQIVHRLKSLDPNTGGMIKFCSPEYKNIFFQNSSPSSSMFMLSYIYDHGWFKLFTPVNIFYGRLIF